MTPEELTKCFERMLSHIDLEEELFQWGLRLYADDFYGGFIPVLPPCTALVPCGSTAMVKWKPRSLLARR